MRACDPVTLSHAPFYFLRHGETDWNLNRRAQGQIDIPLNATGVRKPKPPPKWCGTILRERIVRGGCARWWEFSRLKGKPSPNPLPEGEGLGRLGNGDARASFPLSLWEREGSAPEAWEGEGLGEEDGLRIKPRGDAGFYRLAQRLLLPPKSAPYPQRYVPVPKVRSRGSRLLPMSGVASL